MMKLYVILLVSILILLPQTSALLSDGLVRAFTFDNVSSNSTYTISLVGDGNASVRGALYGLPGIIGQAYEFDGIDDLINLSKSNQLIQSRNFTVSMWAWLDVGASAGDAIISRSNSSDRDYWIWGGAGDSNPGNTWEAITKLDGTNYGGILNDSQQYARNWTHLVMSVNATNVNFYVNGTFIESASFATTGLANQSLDTYIGYSQWFDSFDGRIDEVYIWNRFLTQTEITQLYGGGAGNQYPFIQDNININLISPTNASSLISTSNNFTANYSIVNGVSYNFTNTTYYIWSSTGTIINRTTITITGNTTNTSSLVINNLSLGDYKWNVYACAINKTGVTCNFGQSNYTFTQTAFTVNNVSYNSRVYETSRQTFNLNISTISSILSLSAFLVYNGTNYLASSTCSNGQCIITRSIDVPLAYISPLQNKTFLWNVSVYDGTQVINSLTSSSIQEIQTIFLTSCTTPLANVTLNFTAYDEQNRTVINPFNFKATFNAWLGNGDVQKNFSFNSQGISNIMLCLSPNNETFKIDADIFYGTSQNISYSERNYYFRNASIINNTSPIPLFLLRATSATSFILYFTDVNTLPINDTLIYTQRFYPELNRFDTVQMALTDNNGKSIGFFETEVTDYKFILIKKGTILLTTEKKKIFPESSPFTLSFKLGSQSSGIFTPFQNISNLYYSLTSNVTNGTITFSYIDTSGQVQYGRLQVDRINPSGLPTMVCNMTSILASATLICDISAVNGTYVARPYISRSPEVLIALYNIITGQARDIFGNNGLVISGIIILAVALAFVYYPLPQIIAVNATIVGLNMIGLLNANPIFVFGIMAVSTIVLVVARQ